MSVVIALHFTGTVTLYVPVAQSLWYVHCVSLAWWLMHVLHYLLWRVG